MSRQATYFISDIHLGASYIDNPREHERLVVDWLNSIANDARDLYLLGDILDFWWEYRTVVPRGYIRFFGALARLADAGVRLHWFIGNHDIWLFDYLKTEIGIEIIDGSRIIDIDGQRFFLAHGDGIGKLKPGFKFIRALFRNRTCQKLYGAIHPRWTIGFAHKWSSHSRKNGERCQTSDTPSLIKFAQNHFIENSDINYYIFGHMHILADEKIAQSCRAIILGDWISQFSYARFDGQSLKLYLFANNIASKQQI